MRKVILDLDYVTGYLRDGHFECEIEESLLEQLQSDPESEALQDYVKDNGTLVIDSYRVEDYEFTGNPRIV